MRRQFQALFVGCLLVATPAVGATFGTDVASLSTAYQQETEPSFRLGLQMRLAWTGDYVGPFSSEIDAASLRAIRDFQARHGMSATGIIDEAMLRRLIDVSDRAEHQTGFKMYDEAATGTRVALPTALVADAGPTDVGRVWRSENGTIEIEAVRMTGDGQSIDGLFDVLGSPAATRTVESAVLSTDGFSVSGTENGRPYSMRFGGTDGDVRGYVVSYDRSVESAMRPFVTVAMNLFEPVAPGSELRLVGRESGESNVARRAETVPNVSLLHAGIAPDADSESSGIDSSGSGFVVSKDGWLLTNAHVAKSCRSVLVGTAGKADKVLIDEENDLALVHVDADLGAPLPIAAGVPRLGEDILALGYPLRSILADSLNVTRGNVSSLLGLGNDKRYLQISAPVQPGNSGGPLVDLSGRVVGIVTAKLNAVAIADATGDIPQSINFAIRPDAAIRFLDDNDIAFIKAAERGADKSVADTTEGVQSAIHPVLCLNGE
ncbi:MULTISPECIES: serine protease [unclassified Aureimonas]|uniref:serine protease n=1 Tax=unclassified Aureimonas TaxID=2615206 RepID=UPI0006FF151E|nr:MULTISPECIES: serine protease [unclassified Aureimonas]KQT53885.1 serine protease [Aureimonas sp. Leaf427]KQT71673.1 serine protease [Aureimonas sp. Leaf460]